MLDGIDVAVVNLGFLTGSAGNCVGSPDDLRWRVQAPSVRRDWSRGQQRRVRLRSLIACSVLEPVGDVLAEPFRLVLQGLAGSRVAHEFAVVVFITVNDLQDPGPCPSLRLSQVVE
jgi:hypothetical protein